jgi:hypothetical protein
MEKRSDDNVPCPLPRRWLPEATPPEGGPEWDIRVERIVAAAEPRLRRLARGSEIEATWSAGLGSWWKPAAAIAAAAAVLLFALAPAATVQESGEGWLPLSVVAADGEPFALWVGLGIESDPVLALIALQLPAVTNDMRDQR